MKKYFRIGFYQILPIASLTLSPLALNASQCLAQTILEDETLGAERSQVNAIDAMSDRIDGGALRGSNLFHSFQRFDIETGRSVYFNDQGAANIFSRVTGSGLPSSINGTLGAYGTANLFFINPNGIAFGSGARLAVGGSFVATTADSVLFDKGATFSASNPAAPPLLTVDTQAPIGLQFEGKPNSIIVKEVGGSEATKRYFSVLPGNNITLVGGDIEIFGKGGDSNISTLQAPKGKISLGSVSETGTVKISDGNLEIPNGLRRGNISFKNGALLETTNEGITSIYANDAIMTEASKISGSLSINAIQNIQIEGGSKLDGENINFNSGTINITGGSEIGGNYLTTKALKNVQIEGGSKIIVNQFKVDSKSLNIKDTKEGELLLGDAKINAIDDVNLLRGRLIGSNINLNSGSLTLDDVSKFVTGITASGNVGNIVLQVRGKISLDRGSSLFTGVPPKKPGNAGSIDIYSNSLELRGKSEINSSQSQSGKAGNIFLKVHENISFLEGSQVFSSISEGAVGQSGDIRIDSASLNVLNSSRLNAAVSGTGDAGNIYLNVRGLTLLDENSQLLASVDSTGTGNTGNVDIKSGLLTISNGAEIVNGNSGNNIKEPGNIIISALNQVKLLNGGGIRGGIDKKAKATSSGGIDITSRSLLIEDGSQIELKNSGVTQGTKTIFIKASESVVIDGYQNNSYQNPKIETGIITDVQGGASANAGGITIETPNLTLRNNARITASTASGDGGNVNLKDIRLLLLRRNSQISATVKQANGNGGNISIDAPNGFVIAVPSERSFITANALLDAGGKVTINAKAIFGLARPSRAELVKYFRDGLGKKLEDVQSEEFNSLISISAITAVSQKDAALDGQVTLNAPINPNQGVNQILREPRSTVVSDSCQVSDGKESVQFFDIGRGGLPPRPEDPLSVDLLEWIPVPEIAPQPSSSLFMPQTKSGIDVNLPDRASRSFQISNTYLKLLPPCQSR
jgi:filamentous hemagglutinin family protein